MCLFLGQLAVAAPGDASPAAAGSCVVRTTDMSLAMTNAMLAAQMNQYFAHCSSRLFSSLDTIYESEKRDEKWSSTIEGAIGSATAATDGISTRGACRASLCRYEFGFSNPEKRVRIKDEFDKRLLSEIKDPGLVVSQVYKSTPSHGFLVYFYRAVPPAAFVNPLRQMMEGILPPDR
jgi:hypothetical protein